MRRLFVAGALMAALVIPASGQEAAQLTPGHLPAGVTPVRYEITVTPDANALTLAGQVRIDLQVAAPTREIVLNALELTFDHVDLDAGRTAPRVVFDARTQTAHLTFAHPIAAGEHALNISYHGRIYRSAQGLFAVDYDAPHAGQGAHERALFTQFEAADARRFVPCFDEPLLKAIFQINTIVPQDRMAVSNMPQDSVDTLAGGLKRVRFAPTPKMSSYLMFLGVGDFERITTNVDGVEIGVVAKRGSVESGRFALESAAQILRYYNDYFGTPYPLPKMDMIAGPGGGGFGAMENWGAIFYFERAILVDPTLSSESDRQGAFGTIAHEMAHQWFGDLVTMAWWDDIWLNEGFATWMASRATQQLHADWNPWLRAQTGRQGAMAQDSRATTHPIVQQIDTVDQANQAFDNITYRKGAAVIRMIENHVGADNFRDGVRAYMRTHAYGNARTAGLWDAIEHASSEPMRQIANDFTMQPGLPLITVEPGPCRRNSREIVLHQGRYGVDQASRAPLLWHVPAAAAFIGHDGGVGGVTDDTGVARLHVADCRPFLINPDQAGYYRVAYPAATFRQLAGIFASIHALDQYGLLSDSRALGATGPTPYTDSFDLAKRTPITADPLVWELITQQVLATDSLYAGLANAPTYREFARNLLGREFRRVGWDKRAGEADNVAVLRERLIDALGAMGDPLVVAEAQRRFAANALTAATRQATLNTVGANANAATFAALLQQAQSSTGTLQKTSYYIALAHAQDPALAERALGHAFDADVPGGQNTRMIAAVADRHPELAWRFADTHQEALAALLDPLQRVEFMPGLAEKSNDPAVLGTLRTYIDTRVPADVRRDVEGSYLQLGERLRLRTERLPQLDAWLRTNGS